MKKNGVLNAQLSGLIASLGHKDLFMIGDAGMPIPSGIPVVDLALCCGVPRFEEVLTCVLQEAEVEAFYCAAETEQVSPQIFRLLENNLKEKECVKMTHEELKKFSGKIKFAVRTGETTSYANVILQSGVVF